jgi:hypothetical protein
VNMGPVERRQRGRLRHHAPPRSTFAASARSTAFIWNGVSGVLPGSSPRSR